MEVKLSIYFIYLQRRNRSVKDFRLHAHHCETCFHLLIIKLWLHSGSQAFFFLHSVPSDLQKHFFKLFLGFLTELCE